MNTNTHTLNLYNLYLTRLTTALALLCALCVFLYGIFLLMAVAHTASRTALEHQIKAITAQLGDLEMAYLSQEKTITPEHAQSLGFVAPQVVSVVYTSGPTLTMNTRQ